MHALPIFGITGRSLWFVIANLFSLFRLCWLPLAMLIATTYAMAYGIAEVSPGKTVETIHDGAFLFATMTEIVLNGIVLSVVAVHVHRIILFNDRRPNVYFAFPFGSTELLYVVMGTLTYFALVLLIGVIAYLYYIVFNLVPQGGALLIAAMVEAAAEAAPKANPWLALLGIVTFIVGYILALWLMLRLTVWPPAVVANNRLSLGEALGLSKGRVFELLGLMIASSLAYLAVLFVFAIVIGITAMKTDTAGAWVEILGAGTLVDKVELAFAGKPANPNAVLFEFFYLLTATAYAVAILSYAYKALKGFDVDNAIDKQSAREENDPSLHMPMGAH
jgi:hypothetical protein